jgi:hypothetical protein
MNRKLSLDLDQLSVESFETSRETHSAGTVRAFGFTDTTCNQIICDCPGGGTNVTCATDCDQDTCGDSCVNICVPTAHGEHSCAMPTCLNTCHDTCGCPTLQFTGC